MQESSAAICRREKVQICKLLPHQKVVQPPAFVAGSGVETVVPVGVSCDFSVLPPPCICEASANQQLTEGVPLLLQHHQTCTAPCKMKPTGLAASKSVCQLYVRSYWQQLRFYDATVSIFCGQPSWNCCSQPCIASPASKAKLCLKMQGLHTLLEAEPLANTALHSCDCICLQVAHQK